jgi:GNAT superfamily N-acetyltransferase
LIEEPGVSVRLEKFSDEHSASVVELVQGILRDEFGFSGPSADQPDLLDIPRHYGAGYSSFWVALDGARLVGTTGFVDLGCKQGLLRKMFVRSDYRGTGVALLLLDNALTWARDRGFKEMYLGTNAKFLAAQRFYEKHGFVPLFPESLPESVPRLNLRDRFYFRAL